MIEGFHFTILQLIITNFLYLPLQEFLSPALVEILFPQCPATQLQYKKIFAQNVFHDESTEDK